MCPRSSQRVTTVYRTWPARYAKPLKVDLAAIEKATLAKHPELAERPTKAAAAPAKKVTTKKRPKLGKGK